MPGQALAGVQAVVFDAVGTLIRPCPSVAEAYVAAGRRFGIELSPDVALARFHAAFAAEEALDVDGTTSEAREQRRWRRIVAAVFPAAPDPDRLFDDLWDHFAHAERWALDPHAEEIFTRLGQLGLATAIGSNFDERLPVLCRAWPALATTPVFVSSELGFRKPDPRFFAAVAGRLEVPAGAIVMVGDDYENDFLGARAAGWQAVYLVRPDRGRAAAPLDSPATAPRISSLTELLPLLAPSL